MNTVELLKYIEEGKLNEKLIGLYGEYDTEAKARYVDLINRFEKRFGSLDTVSLYSTPGRTEVGGNHTDHQHGRVLAGAVTLDVIAVVSENDDNIIRVQSLGHDICEVNLSDLSMQPCEENTSDALIRGIAYKITEMGFKIKGFNAYTTTKVLSGSGLSSSAAFEVLIANIINNICCSCKLTPLQLAQISQFAENTYFGKPSGLMDQTACAVGGFIAIDFKDEPIVTPVTFDLGKHGYKLAIVNTRGSHDDLTDEYAAIPIEMKKVSAVFDKNFLREVSEEEFYCNLTAVREQAGDRAVLRAMHFFGDNARVERQTAALQNDDITGFFREVNASGASSIMMLQNIYCIKDPENQSMTIALALARKVLKADGACRVHGGGFAGTIQAYIKDCDVFEFVKTMDAAFGEGCCYILDVREAGAIKVL